MKTSFLVFHAFQDLIVRLLPNFKKREYSFAFLIHPRNIQDVYRKYPFAKYFSDEKVEWFLRYFWPIITSEITGLKISKTGKEIKGYIIGVPLLAKQMLEERELAKKRIIQAIKLAEKKGAKIVGLGALTSSVTKGGLDLVDRVKCNITTGHAYTAHNVTSNIFKLAELFNADKKRAIIAVVGAAGSVGSTSAQLIARAQFANLLLIDIERKAHLVNELIPYLKNLNPNINIEVSHQIGTVKKADFIITATNTPEALIEAEDLKSGAVVIDDAQPSDVSPEALKREDIMVIEAGLVHTPNIRNHFNFGFRDKYDNYCCLAEVLILASEEWNSHYVINRATLELVDEISELGNKLGFHVAEFQNFQEKISERKLLLIKNIIQKNQQHV